MTPVFWFSNKFVDTTKAKWFTVPFVACVGVKMKRALSSFTSVNKLEITEYSEVAIIDGDVHELSVPEVPDETLVCVHVDL